MNLRAHKQSANLSGLFLWKRQFTKKGVNNRKNSIKKKENTRKQKKLRKTMKNKD